MLANLYFFWTGFGGKSVPQGRVQYSGYWPEPKIRTKKELKAERERLGIIPKKVEKVIERVAVQYLERPDANAENMLHAALERQNLAYRALYFELLKLKIAEDDDEDDVLLMLMLH